MLRVAGRVMEVSEVHLIKAPLSTAVTSLGMLMETSEEQSPNAMQPFFPDTDIPTLETVAKSYRETDSWMKTPVMTEDAFHRLLEIIDFNGQLKAPVAFGELVDNSFAERAVKEVG